MCVWVTSATFAAVYSTWCTRLDSLFVPMCAFMPKYHWLPFFVWCIPGLRFPLLFLFLIELGAAMIAGSTIVPTFRYWPLRAKCVSPAPRSCVSSSRRKLRIVVSSGMLASPPKCGCG